MEFDAFTGGVDPGGLNSREQIKILICFLMDQIKYDFTPENITNILTSQALANYFEITQSLAELEKNQNIVVQKGTCHLSPSGSAIAQRLVSNIPFTVREKALRAAEIEKVMAKRAKDNKITIQKDTDGGYFVHISMYDQEKEFFNLSIKVFDRDQAETIKSNFIQNPTDVYISNLKTLLHYNPEEKE